MPDNTAIQIGIGGLFALMVIREVLGFLKTRSNGKRSSVEHTAGDLSPEFWQADSRKAVAEVIAITVVPMLAAETAILAELRSGNAEVNKHLALILDRLTQERRQ